MRKHKLLLTLAFMCLSAVYTFGQPQHFSTSLHATRAGKPWWYAASNGGFEVLTNVPMTHPNMGCTQCHGAKNADGVLNGSNYQPGCVDCHPSNSFFNPDSLKESQCYSCHSRQGAEVSMGYTDVHRTAGKKCWDCHTTQDMHGNGTTYNNMFEYSINSGQSVDCASSGCHTTLPTSHAAKDPHNGKLHCTSCHSKSVISCYNCHFESQVNSYKKRARAQIRDFVLLVNRQKDNKVGIASFQSLTYQGHAFVAFGPYTPHTTVKTGARGCADCHKNFGGQISAIDEYNTSHVINFVKFNAADSNLIVKKGIVPMPADYKSTFKMDFLTYNGNTADTVLPSKNWSPIGKNTWDMHQMFYCSPLTKAQMAKIGMDTLLTSVNEIGGTISDYYLEQNYPNPFNPTTVIYYTVPELGNITLKVYDVTGKEVKTLIDGTVRPGQHSIQFSGEGLSSGVYFYTLKGKNFTQTRKMILAK